MDGSPAHASCVDDVVVLSVLFLMGLVSAIAGLIEEGASTPAAIGLLMMTFAVASFVRDVWGAGHESRALRKR